MSMGLISGGDSRLEKGGKQGGITGFGPWDHFRQVPENELSIGKTFSSQSLPYVTPVAGAMKGGEYRSDKIRKMRGNEKEGDNDGEMGGSGV